MGLEEIPLPAPPSAGNHLSGVFLKSEVISENNFSGVFWKGEDESGPGVAAGAIFSQGWRAESSGRQAQPGTYGLLLLRRQTRLRKQSPTTQF